MKKKSVAVITGTVGNLFLSGALLSVRQQTYSYEEIEHWVIIDGQAYEQDVRKMLHGTEKVVVLPDNTGGTGGGGFTGHRIYGSVPWLVSTDYVCFLDEDNCFAPDHLEHLVKACEGRQWAHSLRSLIAQDGTLLGKDCCESLGGIRNSVLGPGDYLVDTNCYLLPTDLARHISPCWNVVARPTNGQLEADRAVCQTLLKSTFFPGVSRHHSVMYRVSSRADSVSIGFFERGNAQTCFDASKTDMYLFDFCTSVYVETLRTRYNVLDGFTNRQIIPPDSTVLLVTSSTLPCPVIHGLMKDTKRKLLVVYDDTHDILVFTSDSHEKTETNEKIRRELSQSLGIELYLVRKKTESCGVGCEHGCIEEHVPADS